MGRAGRLEEGSRLQRFAGRCFHFPSGPFFWGREFHRLPPWNRHDGRARLAARCFPAPLTKTVLSAMSICKSVTTPRVGSFTALSVTSGRPTGIEVDLRSTLPTRQKAKALTKPAKDAK